MSEGTVFATFVIVLRETLEAGLIVGIILTVLTRLRSSRYFPHVWASCGIAVVASFLAGWLLSLATHGVQGHWEKVIEGSISLAACGVLTYMVFWMDRQAKRIRPEIEHQVENAVGRHELFAIMALPFLAVFREGAETVLFLKAVAIQSGGAVSLGGGLLGAACAIGITAAIFVGGRRLPLKPLFRWTGLLLLLIAAGLLAYGIHELQELGWIPMVIYPLWDTSALLSEKEGLGAFFKALFGYNANPSLIEVLAYFSYLIGTMLILRPWRRPPTPATPPSPPAPARSAKVEPPIVLSVSKS